mmetsp:Transcript_36151/g.85765  ORF Transcript_36151/g.85765 Transcript_36151/m.85765 type:complete len:121 (+) Transcript_36151:134-496(+)
MQTCLSRWGSKASCDPPRTAVDGCLRRRFARPPLPGSPLASPLSPAGDEANTPPLSPRPGKIARRLTAPSGPRLQDSPPFLQAAEPGTGTGSHGAARVSLEVCGSCSRPQRWPIGTSAAL